MTVLPTQLFLAASLGLAAVIFLVFGLALLWAALARPRTIAPVRSSDRIPHAIRAAWAPPPRRRHAMLAIALALILVVFAGQYLVGLFFPSMPERSQPTSITTKMPGASGARLAIESLGPQAGPVLVFTHGWGADGREWSYYRGLADRYGLLIWDLPGLGESGAIPDGYTMERMAGDLRTVINSAGDRPVILVGHSIGGMLNLTYARLYRDDLGKRVKGIVQFNTTYTNPLRTTKDADRHLALQKTVYEPLLHAVQLASPVVRAAGWLSYTSGLAHLQLASQSFAGTQTREELDFAARYAYRSSPGVVAAGVLAMMNWDGSDAMAQVGVPTLIVTSAKDTTTLPEASAIMKREIRISTLVSIDPAAHLGPIEQHERYATELRAFVDRVAAGPSGVAAP